MATAGCCVLAAIVIEQLSRIIKTNDYMRWQYDKQYISCIIAEVNFVLNNFGTYLSISYISQLNIIEQ